MSRLPQLGAWSDWLTWLENLGNPIAAAPALANAMNTKLPGTSATPAQVLVPSVIYPPPPAPRPAATTLVDLSTATSADQAVTDALSRSVLQNQAAAQNFFNSQFPPDIATPAPGITDLLSGILPDLAPSTWILVGTAAAVVALVALKKARPL